jgi:hypothetical protein
MREDFYWTDLCLAQISDELATLGTPLCPSTVQDLLDEFDFSKRKIAKNLSRRLITISPVGPLAKSFRTGFGMRCETMAILIWD